MGILKNLFGDGGGLKAAGEVAQDVADIFTTSDREKLAAYKAETRRLEISQKDRDNQTKINLEEARQSGIFTKWRPAIGWILAISLGYHFLFFRIFGPFIEKYLDVQLYDVEWTELSILLTGMLGMSVTRSYEKQKGIARNK